MELPKEYIKKAADTVGSYIYHRILAYKAIGTEADWMQEKAWFLIYEIGTNKLLENINFPEDKIPNYIIQDDTTNNA